MSDKVEIKILPGNEVSKNIEVFHKGKKVFCTELVLLFDMDKKEFVEIE